MHRPNASFKTESESVSWTCVRVSYNYLDSCNFRRKFCDLGTEFSSPGPTDTCSSRRPIEHPGSQVTGCPGLGRPRACISHCRGWVFTGTEQVCLLSQGPSLTLSTHTHFPRPRIPYFKVTFFSLCQFVSGQILNIGLGIGSEYIHTFLQNLQTKFFSLCICFVITGTRCWK